jgi:hypothetical protein
MALFHPSSTPNHAAPRLGEHSTSMLAWILGLDAIQIAALERYGIIITAPV